MAQRNNNNYNKSNQNQQTKKAGSPYISAKIDRLINGEGSTMAYASVTVSNAVAIHGIRVVNSRNGLFVSMPSRSYKDSNGNTKYNDIAHAVTKEAHEAINSKVLEAYSQALAQTRETDFTPMSDDEDLPFDEEEAGSYYFSPAM